MYRCFWCFLRIGSGYNKWNTYSSVGGGRLETAINYARAVWIEITVALILMAAQLAVRWGRLSAADIFTLVYLSLVITFPAYVFVTTTRVAYHDVAAAGARDFAATCELKATYVTQSLNPGPASEQLAHHTRAITAALEQVGRQSNGEVTAVSVRVRRPGESVRLGSVAMSGRPCRGGAGR